MRWRNNGKQAQHTPQQQLQATAREQNRQGTCRMESCAANTSYMRQTRVLHPGFFEQQQQFVSKLANKIPVLYLDIVLEGRLHCLQLLRQEGALQAQVHGTLQASIASNNLLIRQPAQRLGDVLLRDSMTAEITCYVTLCFIALMSASNRPCNRGSTAATGWVFGCAAGVTAQSAVSSG
jgi:hypothetical protein